MLNKGPPLLHTNSAYEGRTHVTTSFTGTARSGHTAGTQYLKKIRTRRGKQTSQAPLEEKVSFPKGLLLEQKKVFFVCFFTGNQYNIANQAYSNKHERKIEKVIVKKISTTMATVRSREILTESQKQTTRPCYVTRSRAHKWVAWLPRS